MIEQLIKEPRISHPIILQKVQINIIKRFLLIHPQISSRTNRIMKLPPNNIARIPQCTIRSGRGTAGRQRGRQRVVDAAERFFALGVAIDKVGYGLALPFVARGVDRGSVLVAYLFEVPLGAAEGGVGGAVGTALAAVGASIDTIVGVIVSVSVPVSIAISVPITWGWRPIAGYTVGVCNTIASAIFSMSMCM